MIIRESLHGFHAVIHEFILSSIYYMVIVDVQGCEQNDLSGGYLLAKKVSGCLLARVPRSRPCTLALRADCTRAKRT